MSERGQVGDAFIDLGIRTDKARRDMQRAEGEIARSASSVEKKLANLKMTIDGAMAKRSLSEVQRAHDVLKAKLDKKIRLDADMASVDRTRNALRVLEEKLDGLKAKSKAPIVGGPATESSITKIIGGISVLGAVYGALNLAKKGLEITQSFEDIQARLESMYGSVDRAAQVLDKFQKVAASTPFSLRDVAEGGVTLKAFGMDAEANIKILADLAAFMGVTVPEAAGAWGRAFAGGAGAADIFRERGVLNLIKSFKGIDDLTKLTLPDFRRAMEETFSDKSGGIAGATDRLSKNISGKISNMFDAIEVAVNRFGKKLAPMITMLAEQVTDLVTKLSPVETEFEKASGRAAALESRFNTLASRVLALGDTWNKAEDEQRLYKESLDALMKEYPNYFAGFDTNVSKFDDIKTAIEGARKKLDEYTSSMVKNAIVQDKLNEITELGEQKYNALISKKNALQSYNEREKNGTLDQQVQTNTGGVRSYGGLTYRDLLNQQLKDAEKAIDDNQSRINKLSESIQDVDRVLSGQPPKGSAAAGGGGKAKDPVASEAIKARYDAERTLMEALQKSKREKIADDYEREKQAAKDERDLRLKKIADEVKDVKAASDLKKAVILDYNTAIESIEKKHTEEISKEIEQGRINFIAINAKYNKMQQELGSKFTEPGPASIEEAQANFDKSLKGSRRKNMREDPEEQSQRLFDPIEESANLAATTVSGTWTSAFDAMVERSQIFGDSTKNIFASMAEYALTQIDRILVQYGLLKASEGALDLFPGSGFLKFIVKGLGGTVKGHNGGEFVGTSSGVKKMASGGSFIVPPGFPNDSFPMLVESGERVSVTPRSQVGSDAAALRVLAEKFDLLNLNLVRQRIPSEIRADVYGELSGQDIMLSQRSSERKYRRTRG